MFAAITVSMQSAVQRWHRPPPHCVPAPRVPQDNAGDPRGGAARSSDVWLRCMPLAWSGSYIQNLFVIMGKFVEGSFFLKRNNTSRFYSIVAALICFIFSLYFPTCQCEATLSRFLYFPDFFLWFSADGKLAEAEDKALPPPQDPSKGGSGFRVTLALVLFFLHCPLSFFLSLLLLIARLSEGCSCAAECGPSMSMLLRCFLAWCRTRVVNRHSSYRHPHSMTLFENYVQ